jgi:NADPH2:quinone reductase
MFMRLVVSGGSMRAIEVETFGTTDVLELVDRDVPEPGPGQVRIETEAIGVNFADIMQRRGTYPGGPEPPYTPGFETAGVVDALGPDITDLAEGDRVVGYPDGGAYAEYALCRAEGLFAVPDGMSFETAAAYPVQFLTAHNCLFEWGGLESGERVLIHAAAGGVGSAAVQLASRAGAEVFGTASSDEKLAHIDKLGCDHPINYVENDFAEEITEITDGGGVDLVLDGVGGETHTKSYDILKHFGRIVAFGVASGDVPKPDVWDLLFENHSVIGFHLGQSMNHDPERVLGAVPELSQILANEDVTITIGARFPLEEAAKAHQHIENRENIGKVVLTT